MTFRSTLLHMSLLCVSVSFAAAQSSDSTENSSFQFLPGRITVAPLVANYQEARVGVRQEIGATRLKLDIGSSVDVVAYTVRADTSFFRMGFDFFTYALTTSSEGLRLQVDAVDGYFGGHVTFQSRRYGREFALRLRLLHLSAHFLDGHYSSGGQWKDGRNPIPFTRDFGELVGMITWGDATASIRAYSGFGYSTLVRPVNIRRITTLHGIEAHTSRVTGPVFGKPFNFYAADHLTFAGIPEYIGTNNIEAGIKLGPWDATGIRIYGNYYTGLDVFSQYYDVRRNLWGVGIAIDFW